MGWLTDWQSIEEEQEEEEVTGNLAAVLVIIGRGTYVYPNLIFIFLFPSDVCNKANNYKSCNVRSSLSPLILILISYHFIRTIHLRFQILMQSCDLFPSLKFSTLLSPKLRSPFQMCWKLNLYSVVVRN